jgi:hypothetical protein
MATDAKLAMQASVTKTGTFNSTAIDLKTKSPLFGNVLWCRLVYQNANTSSGAGAATFRLTFSSDNSTFAGIAQTADTVLTLSTTAISGEVFIPIVTDKRYVRLELSAISGTDATVDYFADLVMAKP